MSTAGFAVVTGAASGIGAATARLLAAQGPVLLVDVAAATLRDTAAELEATGAQVQTALADVSDEEQVAAAFASLPACSWVRTLVNSAGIFDHHPAEQMPTQAWRRVLDVNLTGTFLCCRTAFPLFRRGSAVVNVGSLNAHAALADRVNYAASKAGVLMLSKCLAVEWADAGVRVVSVSPGVIDTPMNRSVEDRVGGSAESLLRIPLQRTGTAEEVAAVIAFVASDAAAYVTASDVQVDGGWVGYGAM